MRMKFNSTGEQLIQELVANPTRFTKEGKGLELLREYFEGFSLETLRPLLSNSDLKVRKEAVAILSELGTQGCDLLDAVVLLVNDLDLSIKYDALECIMVCSVGQNAGEFLHVLRSMESNVEVLRILAMRLSSNADPLQLQAAFQGLETFDFKEDIHKKGLITLLNSDFLDTKEILSMIDDNEALTRKYGAITAKRLFGKYPELIRYALLSKDSDVQKFAKDFIDLQKKNNI